MPDDEKPKTQQSTLAQEAEALQAEIRAQTASIFEREVSHLEFYYLLSCYPYLAICSTKDPYIHPNAAPAVKYGSVGWNIVDFGTVLYGGSNRVSAENCSPPQGTLMRQAERTVVEMIGMAIRRWPEGATVVSGFYPMQRMAKIIGDREKYPVAGFELSQNDLVVEYWYNLLSDKILYPPEARILGSVHDKK